MGHDTHTDYDWLGRPLTVRVNYVSGGAVDNQTNLRTVTKYNAAGDRLSVTDPKGVMTQYQYNQLDHLWSGVIPWGV